MKKLILLTLILFTTQTFAQDPTYKKADIARNRYGSSDERALLQNVIDVKADLLNNLVAQEKIIEAFHASLYQYVSNFRLERKEPININLIGFPATGKSQIGNILRKIMPVVHIDAQKYIDPKNIGGLVWAIKDQIEDPNKPFILLIDELDKIKEMTKENEFETHPFIAAVNQILVEGFLNNGYSNVTLNNALILSTMNFPTNVISEFSKEALDEKKDFYKFGIEDFTKFTKWLEDKPEAIRMVLSKMYRSNTVSRLATNTHFMNHFDKDAYKRVVKYHLENTIKNLKESPFTINDISYSNEYFDFLVNNMIYPAEGARPIVYKARDLTEQIISYALAKRSFEKKYRDLPVRFEIGFDEIEKKALLNVHPLKRVGTQYELASEEVLKMEFSYNDSKKIITVPDDLDLSIPKSYFKALDVTRTQIKYARQPYDLQLASKLEKFLNQNVYGQEFYTAPLSKQISKYMGLKSGSITRPNYEIMIGFPGIGKSEISNYTTKFLDIPEVKVELSKYNGNDNKTLESFFRDVNSKITKALKDNPTGKYIISFDEFDKLFEIAPNGELKDRAVLPVLKELLDTGKSSITVADAWGGDTTLKLNINDAFTFVTMNFNVALFKFEADPRLTTIDDTFQAYKQLIQLKNLKEVLSRMFRPETVNRMLDSLTVLKPLDEEAYEKIIRKQMVSALKERFYVKGQDHGFIDARFTDSFFQLIKNETIVPSEGGRFTFNSSKKLILNTIEKAMIEIPRKYLTQPLVIEFDYEPKKQMISADAHVKNSAQKKFSLFNQNIKLRFPDVKIHGAIPEDRLMVAAHEFGHALVSVLLGLEVERVSAYDLDNGFVKFANQEDILSIKSEIYHLYATVASRSMERVIFSGRALERASVLDITLGSGGDIENLTKSLFSRLMRSGLDPNGGPFDYHMGKDTDHIYYNVQALPFEKVEKMSHLLAAMEDKMVKDLTDSFSMEWMKEKIIEIARLGDLKGEEFYRLIDLPMIHETQNEASFIASAFQDVVEVRSPSKPIGASTQKISFDLKGRSVADFQKEYLKFFETTLIQNPILCNDKLSAKTKGSQSNPTRRGW